MCLSSTPLLRLGASHQVRIRIGCRARHRVRKRDFECVLREEAPRFGISFVSTGAGMRITSGDDGSTDGVQSEGRAAYGENAWRDNVSRYTIPISAARTTAIPPNTRRTFQRSRPRPDVV